MPLTTTLTDDSLELALQFLAPQEAMGARLACKALAEAAPRAVRTWAADSERLEALALLPALSRVHMRPGSAPLGPAGRLPDLLAALPPCLAELGLEDQRLRDLGPLLGALTGGALPRVRTLMLGGNQALPCGELLDALAAGAAPLLSRLSLRGTGCAGGEALAAALRACPGMTWLNVSDNPLERAAVAAMAEAAPRLRVLKAATCALGPAAPDLCGALGAELRVLLVSTNGIDAPAAAAALRALRARCPRLEELSLLGNRLKAPGLRALQQHLAAGVWPRLRALWLSSNGAPAHGVVAALGAASAVAALDIGACGVDDEGAQAVADALGEGALPQLESLGLGMNRISDEGAVSLAAALAACPRPRLRVVDVANNNIALPGARRLLAVAEQLGVRVNVVVGNRLSAREIRRLTSSVGGGPGGSSGSSGSS